MHDDDSTKICIDIGCGAKKKKGAIGIDIQKGPGVDHVVDLTKDPLPFEDNTVDYVYSSHFLEHLPHPVKRILSEISRVCKPEGKIELWTPYLWSNDAFVMGHQTFFSETPYMHICCHHPDVWSPYLKKRWLLHEIQYIVEMDTLSMLKDRNIELGFAIRHLHNIVKEVGVHISVVSDFSKPSPPLLRTFAQSRSGLRYEIKDQNALDGTGYEKDHKQKIIDQFASGPALA